MVMPHQMKQSESIQKCTRGCLEKGIWMALAHSHGRDATQDQCQLLAEVPKHLLAGSATMIPGTLICQVPRVLLSPTDRSHVDAGRVGLRGHISGWHLPNSTPRGPSSERDSLG